MRSRGWSPCPAGCVLVRRDTRVCTGVLSLLALSEERLFRECGPSGRVLSSGTQSHWTWIWDVQPLERQEICFVISATQPVLFCYSPRRLTQLHSVGEKSQAFPNFHPSLLCWGSQVVLHYLCSSGSLLLGVCVFLTKKNFGFTAWLSRSLFPNQGSNLWPLQWELRLLTTGPPGKSLFTFKMKLTAWALEHFIRKF